MPIPSSILGPLRADPFGQLPFTLSAFISSLCVGIPLKRLPRAFVEPWAIGKISFGWSRLRHSAI
jgi:hypothetical protein